MPGGDVQVAGHLEALHEQATKAATEALAVVVPIVAVA